MPGKSLSGGHRVGSGDATVAGKTLYAVDARLTATSPVDDIDELTAQATAAVRAGRGHVLDTSHVIFPNGAVTLVLILAESHLAIHTWPEENLIAIDLFSCGAIDGQRVAGELTHRLRLAEVQLQLMRRAPGRPAPVQVGSDRDSPN
jgi:S-adenosylmethionine decarboxylase